MYSSIGFFLPLLAMLRLLAGEVKTALFYLIEREDTGFDHHATDFHGIFGRIPPSGRTRC